MDKNKNKGFTLVELLVVIAIIGILASVVLVSLNSARSKARDARRISDLHQLSLALENYYDANQAYPATLPLLETTYLAKVPMDPTGTGVYVYTYSAASCTGATDGQKYALKAVLENNNAAVNSDADNSQCGITAAPSCGTGGTAGNEKEYCIVP